jgi:pimeloyl-ACP methyl ester carboxylesterase
VGNAWGGHVGIVFAAAHPDRCRSLIAVGAPVHAGAATAHLRNGALVILPGSGHIGPLLQAAPAVVTLVTAFWRDPHATITQHRSQAARPPASTSAPMEIRGHRRCKAESPGERR